MKISLTACLLALHLFTAPSSVFAGLDEGLAAFKKQDFAGALREWRPLAEQGEAAAQITLGMLYENGKGVTQDHKEAARWYRLAAEQGQAKAQIYLGSMYSQGKGVPQNFKEAAHWYRLAANQGLADAQYNIGVMHNTGRGVLQDYKEAATWYQLAADQGHSEAQNSLGFLHEHGVGVPEDYAQAFRWYRLSAAQDNPDAQYNLGRFLGRGQIFPAAQHALYSLARANGNEEAANAMESLEFDLSTKELKEARTLAGNMAKPDNLLKALDTYLRSHSGDKPRKISATSSSGPYPAQPAKRPGVVSCNTNCNNGDCYRTYDSGRKVHFQAKHRYDALQGNWIWDAGSC